MIKLASLGIDSAAHDIFEVTERPPVSHEKLRSKLELAFNAHDDLVTALQRANKFISSCHLTADEVGEAAECICDAEAALLKAGAK